MKHRVFVQFFFNLTFCSVMVIGQQDDSISYSSYSKMATSAWTESSDNTTFSREKQKTNLATSFGENTSTPLINTTPDDLIESSAFEMCSNTETNNSSTTENYDNNATLINRCNLLQRCSENTTKESRNRSLSVQTTDGTAANRCSDIQLCNKSMPVELATLCSPIDPCYNVGTCNVTASFEHQFCRCDERCTMYNDCCIDTEQTPNINKYSPYVNCYKGHSFRHYEGFFAVVGCPSAHGNASEKRMCEEEDNIVRDGPCVVGPDGMVFKNKYCALCHGINTVQTFRLSFWFQTSLHLHRTIETISNFSKIAKIEYLLRYTKHEEIPPPHITPRYCMMHLLKDKGELCQAYSNPVYIWGWLYYRNYFCVPETKRNLTKCLGRNYDRIAVPGRWQALPMTVMFTFKTSTTDYVEDSCDIWTKRLEEEGKCAEKERVSNFGFTFKLIKLVSNKPLPFSYVDMIGPSYGLSMEIDNLVQLGKLQYIGVENASSILITRMELVFFTTMFEDEMKKLNDRMENMQWKMYVKDEYLGYETMIIKETLKGHNTKASVFDIYENETGIRTTKLLGGSRLKFKNVIPKNEKFCDNVIVNVLITNVTDINVTAVVCEYHPGFTRDFTFIKTITTYICFAISVISLLLLIVLYRKLGLSSSIPGSNLENISISLVMSKVLFMVGIGLSDIRELCYVIGVLLHFLWLSTFYFMSVSVLCIVINVTKMQSNGNNRKDSLNSKKLCLTFGGLIFPLLFVCPAILLDVYGDDYFNSGYGKEPCFPNHFPSNLMFFSGPVMLTIAINFICLMKVICTLRRLSREIGRISMSPPSTNAKVYIRVVILSGLFWSIGILTAFLDDEWIEFLFTILCGLQGFFISLASLTTERVIRNFYRLKKSTIRTVDSSNMSKK